MWYPMVGDVSKGVRPTVAGRDIHCGDQLLLRAVRVEYDDNGLPHTRYLNDTDAPPVPVRFELDWRHGRRIPVMYGELGGYLWIKEIDTASMWFRWPDQVMP